MFQSWVRLRHWVSMYVRLVVRGYVRISLTMEVNVFYVTRVVARDVMVQLRERGCGGGAAASPAGGERSEPL